MKTFKQFLEESYDTVRTNNGSHVNVEKIGPHLIKTRMHPNSGDGTASKGYDAGYTVNGNYHTGGSPISNGHKTAIALHASKVIDKFVGQHKPPKITFEPANDEHAPAFHKFALALAKKHGYEHKCYGGCHTLTRKPE